MSDIILASSSKQRALIMDTLGVEYRVVPSDYDEASHQAGAPEERATQLAQAKAKEVALRHPEAIIIAADTFSHINGTLFEKPRDLAEAAKMLEQLSGEWSVSVTGFCYLDPNQDRERVELVEVITKFRPLSGQEIERYVKEQPVTDWSASFCPGFIEGASFIEKIDGSLTAFNYGLPIELVAEELRRSGIEF